MPAHFRCHFSKFLHLESNKYVPEHLNIMRAPRKQEEFVLTLKEIILVGNKPGHVFLLFVVNVFIYSEKIDTIYKSNPIV